jgi:hypothetical protein
LDAWIFRKECFLPFPIVIIPASRIFNIEVKILLAAILTRGFRFSFISCRAFKSGESVIQISVNATQSLPMVSKAFLCAQWQGNAQRIPVVLEITALILQEQHGANGMFIAVLNSSDFVLAKRTLSGPGCFELVADLDEKLALCSPSLVQNVKANYNKAVKRLDISLSEGHELSDEDAEFFRNQMNDAQGLLNNAALFGISGQDLQDLHGKSAFLAYVNRKTDTLEQAVMQYDLSGSDLTAMNLASKAADKILTLNRYFQGHGTSGQENIRRYGDLQKMIFSKIYSSVEDGLCALSQNKFPIVASNLIDLREAGKSKIIVHLPPDSETVDKMFDKLFEKTKEKFQEFAGNAGSIIASIKNGTVITSEVEDLKELRFYLEDLLVAQDTDWKGTYNLDDIKSISGSIEVGLAGCIEDLINKAAAQSQQIGSFLSSAKIAHEKIFSLRSIPGIESKTAAQYGKFSSLVVEASLLACSEIDQLMSHAAAHAAALSKKDSIVDATSPTLAKVPTITIEIVGAVWIDELRAGAYRQAMEKSQGTVISKSNELLSLARDVVSATTAEGLRTFCYILDQFEFLSSIKGEALPAVQSGLKELSSFLGNLVAKFELKSKVLFPWKYGGKEEPMTDPLSIDIIECENLLILSGELKAYVESRSDMALQISQISKVSSAIKECSQIFISGVQRRLEESISGIKEAGGSFEAENSDVLLACLKEALLLKKHQRVLSLFDGPDFVNMAIQQLSGYYEKLSTALALNLQNVDVNNVEKLLKLVRPLCLLDEFTKDASKDFSKLYKKYESELSSKLVAGEKDILDKIKESKFSAVADSILDVYPTGQIPPRIKSELSSSINGMIDSIDSKLRTLTKDLPPLLVKQIHEDWVALAKCEKAVSFASDSVKSDYDQLMKTGDEDVACPVALLVRKSVKTVLKNKLKMLTADVVDLLIAGRYQKALFLHGRLRDLAEFEQMFGDGILLQAGEINSKIKQSVEKRIGDFKEIKLEDYFHNPPSQFFKLFEVGSDDSGVQESDMVSTLFKDQIESVWKYVESKIRDRMSTADLGRESKDTEIIERAIQSLPDGDRKTALIQSLTKEKEASEGKRQELEKAVCSRDVQKTMNLVLSCQPCLQTEYFNSLEFSIKAITDKIVSSLEKLPCQFKFGTDLNKELLFLNELRLHPSMPDNFQKRMDMILRTMRNSFEKAEGDARSNMIALLSTGRKTSVDARFQDVKSTFSFLSQLLELRSEFRQYTQNEILPKKMGENILEAFRFIVTDYQSQSKDLDKLLQAEPVDKPFETFKILSALKVLRERSTIYSKACDGFIALSDLAGSNDTTFVNNSLDPFGGIIERVKKFLIENFKDVPELGKKIALSSERTRAFQLLGKRVGTDPSNLASLSEYVSGDAEIADLLRGSFTTKVQAAGQKLWSDTDQLFGQIFTDAKVGKYRDEGYLASADPELEKQRSVCEQLNILYDHLELFQQYVSPNLPQGSVVFDLVGLGANLLDKLNTIADQVTTVSSDDLDGAAGVLVCLQIGYQELLFRRADSKKIVEKCLEKYQATPAGKGTGISKLGFKLAGSKFRPFGEQIVQSYDAFQGYRAKAFREKTARYKEDYVLKEMKCTDREGKVLATNNRELERMFKQFDVEYKEIVGTCLKEGFGDAAGSFVIKRLRSRLKDVRVQHTADRINWTEEMRNLVPILVAQIFAVWTFHHSKRFLSAMDGGDKESFLFMPHPVQVIAIFCMLGLDSTGSGSGGNLDRSLVQVN